MDVSKDFLFDNMPFWKVFVDVNKWRASHPNNMFITVSAWSSTPASSFDKNTIEQLADGSGFFQWIDLLRDMPAVQDTFSNAALIGYHVAFDTFDRGFEIVFIVDVPKNSKNMQYRDWLSASLPVSGLDVHFWLNVPLEDVMPNMLPFSGVLLDESSDHCWLHDVMRSALDTEEFDMVSLSCLTVSPVFMVCETHVVPENFKEDWLAAIAMLRVPSKCLSSDLNKYRLVASSLIPSVEGHDLDAAIHAVLD